MTLQIPILEAILHPPLGLLRRELIPGIFTGAHDLTRRRGIQNVDAYGLTFSIFTVPAGYGSTLGFPRVYEFRLAQVATTHVGNDGHELISEWHDIHAEGAYWLWQNPFPSRVHIEISPGVQLGLFWLTV